jgi:hypothetical protein
MLEYRISETESKCEPFLLLFEMTDAQSHLSVKAFVRNDVNQFLSEAPLGRAEWTRAFLGEFIEELVASDSVNFGHMSQAGKLSIGPLVASQKRAIPAPLLGHVDDCLQAFIRMNVGIPMTDISAHDFRTAFASSL